MASSTKIKYTINDLQETREGYRISKFDHDLYVEITINNEMEIVIPDLYKQPDWKQSGDLYYYYYPTKVWAMACQFYSEINALTKYFDSILTWEECYPHSPVYYTSDKYFGHKNQLVLSDSNRNPKYIYTARYI